MEADPAAKTMLVDTVTAAIRAALAQAVSPLAAELAASRRVIERQAETIAELREQCGSLLAELEAKADPLEWTQVQLDRARAASTVAEARPSWQRRRPAHARTPD
jgi:hypothetical protein